ncbi:MAG: DUF4105 domain-containing protein [Bacteroidaceae bacterium]|nr:DUF4105 domain-containing protein [Bacteroidaceae bacterium]
MLRKLRFFTVIAMLSVVLGMRATSTVATPCDDVSTDTLRVSLITCAPGPEVYQLFGHSAMRVQRSGVDGFDLVFNYGVFSFSDDFILKFTQGHTDYMLAVYDFQYFLIDYVMRGSTVYEQELNLTHAQREALFDALCINARAENRVYRYNFLYDNCATRPRDRVEQALSLMGEHVVYAPVDTLYTFRELIRHYGANYSWLTFGIDLALGRELDSEATWHEHMFVPMLLQRACDEAVVVNDSTMHERRLVSATRELFHSDVVPINPPTPWYLSPMACALLLLAITIFITLRDVRTGRLSRWYDTLLGVVMCLSGVVIYFLVICSEHPATSFNLHALWLTPCAIMPAVLPYVRKAMPVARWYHTVNVVLILLFALLVVCGVQCVDSAVWPLVAVSLIRSLNFVFYYKRNLIK